MYYFSMVLPCQLELEGEQLGDDLSCYAYQILNIPLCIISLFPCQLELEGEQLGDDLSCYASQILEGLRYLHSLHIAHRYSNYG